MPDKTPQGRIAAFCPPGAWFSGRALGSSVVPLPSFLVIASVPVYHNLVVPTVLDSSLAPFPSFLFGASIAAYHYRAVPTSGVPWGFPSSLSLLFLHATACGLRRTSTSSPCRRLLCCLRCTLKPSASATTHFEAVPALQGARHPCGHRILCLRFARLVRRLSATPPRTQDSIRVGGWPLPDGDSHPARSRRAYLGAITLGMSRALQRVGSMPIYLFCASMLVIPYKLPSCVRRSYSSWVSTWRM